MARHIPTSFLEDDKQAKSQARIESEPVVVIDAYFIRNGERYEDHKTKEREDRLSEEGRAQAVSLAGKLKNAETIYGACSTMARSEEFLKLVLENCAAQNRTRIRRYSGLDPRDPKVNYQERTRNAQVQIAELVQIVQKYFRLAATVQQKSRIAILHVTHTNVNEGFLEAIIADPQGSVLFDAMAVVSPFTHGDFFILRTEVDAEKNLKTKILFKNKEYAVNMKKIDRISNEPLARTELGFVTVGPQQANDPKLKLKIGHSKYHSAVEKYLMFHEYIDFLVNQSDDLAKELKDDESTTFSRQAANVADIVKDQWEKFTQKPQLGFNEMNFSTEIGVSESFLIACLKTGKLKGDAPKAEKLISMLEKGFENGQVFQINMLYEVKRGYKITLSCHLKNPATGKTFDLEAELPLEVLDQISKERLVIE